MLDTTVLVYAALGRDQAQAKWSVARRILLDRDFSTSAQVLAEFYSVVTTKAKPPLPLTAARRWVRALAKKPCLPVDFRIVQAGIEFSRRYQISYWDGAIIAAAEALGASTVYTEDLAHGQTYGKVRVCNPFIEDFLART